MFEVFIVASVFRAILIIYGCFHDEWMEVKYTDIDYHVFTEASRHISNGTSPYMKDTYKYTPLLAFIILPNIYVNIYFGKILFCCFDILVGYMQMKILKPYFDHVTITVIVSVFWLFNPFTMTISSRGNAESVQLFIVTSMFYFISSNHLIIAGCFFGLAVHFKLYPVIYGLPILLYIIRVPSLKSSLIKTFIRAILNKLNDIVVFGIASAAIFTLLGFSMYTMYGNEFIQETYLFHFNRTDLQHNFSPYFYILLKYNYENWFFKLLTFLPQLIIVVWFGVKYHESLSYACFMQTFAFVTFNKVCTSQYFIWYIGLIPLAAPFIQIHKKTISKLFSMWIYGQAVWLLFAYMYEFKKMDVLFYVWIASIQFFIINCYILYVLSKSYQPRLSQKEHNS